MSRAKHRLQITSNEDEYWTVRAVLHRARSRSRPPLPRRALAWPVVDQDGPASRPCASPGDTDGSCAAPGVSAPDPWRRVAASTGYVSTGYTVRWHPV